MASLLRFSEAAALALHAMARVAAGHGEVLSAKTLAHDCRASEAHMIKVCQRLAQGGLLTAHRGAGGGFTLGKERRADSAARDLHADRGPRRSQAVPLPESHLRRRPRQEVRLRTHDHGIREGRPPVPEEHDPCLRRGPVRIRRCQMKRARFLQAWMIAIVLTLAALGVYLARGRARQTATGRRSPFKRPSAAISITPLISPLRSPRLRRSRAHA